MFLKVTLHMHSLYITSAWFGGENTNSTDVLQVVKTGNGLFMEGTLLFRLVLLFSTLFVMRSS